MKKIIEQLINRKTLTNHSTKTPPPNPLPQGAVELNNHSTVQLFNRSTAKQFAFTLAEVLITITIIGVVAAMTIPNLLTDINQRKYNSMSGNFQRKLGEALRVMNGQNTLKGHSTTMSFVNELSKNFKTVKICDKVEECFPAKFKRSGGDEVTTSTLTDSTSLGKNYNTETVGVQFVNGVRAIIAYNPEYKLQKNGDVVSFTKDTNNKTVGMNTDVMTIIFDVSEDDNNKIGEDIFAFNTSLGNSGVCEGTKVGDFCVKDLGPSKAISCELEDMNQDYCGQKKSGSGSDHWAGAQKMCDDIDMKLPAKDDIKRLYILRNDMHAEGSDVIPSTDLYWSSTEATEVLALALDFSDGTIKDYWPIGQKQQQYSVLCIGN